MGVALEDVGGIVGGSVLRQFLEVSFTDDGTLRPGYGADRLGLTLTGVKTAFTYAASAGDFVPVDTTANAVTVTLPDAPADGSVVCVKHVVQGASNAVTVACAGSDVFNVAGGSTSATLSLLNQALLVQYEASAGIWYVVGDGLPLAQLDARFVPFTSQADATISVGAGGVSGDLIVETNGVESARFIFGSAGPPDTRGTLLFNHGDTWSVRPNYNVTTGRWLDVRQGSAASPDAGYVPAVKISRIFAHARTTATGVNAINSATVNVGSTTGFASSGTFYLNSTSTAPGTAVTYTGKTATSFTGCGNHAATTGGEVILDFPGVGDSAEGLAALSVNTAAVNSSGVQAVGGFFGATNDSTIAGGVNGDDACALYARGEILAGGGGRALALCAVGVRNDTSAAAITTQQVFVINNSSADQTYSPTSVHDCAFSVNSQGAKNAAAAMQIMYNGSQFDVGIGFGGGATGAIKTAAISDDSSSVTSFRINGSHTNGIDFSGGTYSGNAIVLGNMQSLAGQTPAAATGNLLSVTSETGGNRSNGIRLGSSSLGNVLLPNNIQLAGYKADGSAAVLIAKIGTTDGVVLGDTSATTLVNGTGITLGADVTISAHNIVTDTTTGMKIGTGTTQKIGLWNKTPIVQPTTAITGAAHVAGTGTIALSDTFGGYTIAQIAAALINFGILA